MKKYALLLVLALCALGAGVVASTPEELIRAAFTGDAEAVRRAIDAGVKVNALHAGATALHLAAEHGHLDIARLLIERGAEVDALDGTEDTPLSWAAACGQLEVAKLLITNGADVQRTRTALGSADEPWRPLFWAVMCEHPAMVRLLLEAGAKTNHRDLIEAIRRQNMEIATALIEAGATVLEKTPDGSRDRIFQVAAATGSIEMLRLLIRHAEPGERLTAGLTTALHQAAERGDLALVRFLLDEQKLSPDGQLSDSLGGVVRLGPTSPEHDEGFTALSRAIENGREEIVQLLLEKNARIAGRTRRGLPLLAFAVKMERTDLLRVFLERGASVNSPDFDGNTALLHAAAAGRIENARLLLAHKASVKWRNKNGGTALMLAASAGHTGMCEFLIKHGARPSDRESKSGQTALHYAAGEGHAATVRALLALGASPALQDSSGRTPQALAQSSGHTEIAELLREKPPRKGKSR
jgi:ankyrin repeat protein